MADQAIAWMRQQRAAAPAKPLFVYFAPGTAHAPHHAPREWIDRYKGRFDAGWDEVRKSTLARQKKLGVVPRRHETRRAVCAHPAVVGADGPAEARVRA